MDIFTEEKEPDNKEPANLEYLSLGGLSVIGVLILSGLVFAGNATVRAFRNTRTAQKALSQVQTLNVTGIQVNSDDPRGAYVLLDKDGDNQADFAVKPKESIEFDKMNGQSGAQWMDKLSLSTFHELKR